MKWSPIRATKACSAAGGSTHRHARMHALKAAGGVLPPGSAARAELRLNAAPAAATAPDRFSYQKIIHSRMVTSRRSSGRVAGRVGGCEAEGRRAHLKTHTR